MNPAIKVPGSYISFNEEISLPNISITRLMIYQSFPPALSVSQLKPPKIKSRAHTPPHSDSTRLYEDPPSEIKWEHSLTLAGYRRGANELYSEKRTDQKELAGTAAFPRDRSLHPPASSDTHPDPRRIAPP